MNVGEDGEAREDRPDEPLYCHACDEPILGEPAATGCFLFVRGDEYREESPPLCPRCAVALGMTALYRWDWEEEDG